MLYVLIDVDDQDWSAQGLDDFEFYDVEAGRDGFALDRLKTRVYRAAWEKGGKQVLIVKHVYTNRAKTYYQHLLNEKLRKPADAGSKLLAEATGEDDPT